MKLWEKGIATDKQIEHFTVGNDRELDLVLAKYDALGSIAHAKMLGQIGLLTAEETNSLVLALEEIIKEVEAGNFEIEDSFEDVHSKIEYLLTVKLGDAGKKIHTARSRNDQVLVDVHLYLKDELKAIKEQVKTIMNEAGAGTFVVKNQHEQHPLMYKMFNTEKWISFAILSFVLLLISFNLVGALTLLVIDKRKDFVLFRNLGMEQRHISWVVFWEGVWVSVFGTVLGLVFGVGLVLLQMNTNLVSTQGTFSIPYPVELRVGDLFLILLLNTFLGIFC